MDLKDKEKVIEALFYAKAYLGHKKNRVHPKAIKYIYTFRGHNSIIDLEKTYQQILAVKEEIKRIKKNGQTLIFVATKNLLTEIVRKYAKDSSFPYLVNKWPAGFLTNFESISKNIKKLNEMKVEKNDSLWEKFPKHEQIKLNRELNKLNSIYEGVSDLKKSPEAIFIIDFKKEKNAFSEAKKMNVKTLGICDTNFNPDLIDFPIIANDDLVTSVETILKLVLE